MRVLIVSENAAERSRARSAMALYLDGVEVIETSSARETRQHIAAAGQPDVFVIDGDLRPQGGFSLLYELRAAAEQEGRVSAPGIVMVERRLDRWLADWSGANAVLDKPVDPFALAATVREVADAIGAERAAVDESADQVVAALED